jgi:serine/threonine protein kinase
MAFVHRLGFAHRDLKSQNVLYDIDSGRAKVLQGVWHVRLTLSGQVADFGMTKQLEQNASHSPRTSSPSEITPTTMMTSAFGTGKMHSTSLAMHYYDVLWPWQRRTWHQSFAVALMPLAPTLLSMVPISTSTVSGAHMSNH